MRFTRAHILFLFSLKSFLGPVLVLLQASSSPGNFKGSKLDTLSRRFKTRMLNHLASLQVLYLFYNPESKETTYTGTDTTWDDLFILCNTFGPLGSIMQW
ncbi:hypothetical protein GUJ93_ZPchr0006g45097 [Zizania palustris]|uniref:Uncharacterized protein n=1 Tax=Zizania palustris TaxID=103762 RepID=A0A8J5W4F0_ZIZPA|nr:hypothetical protein GUJ93_ZPchr0006g45097 [Zizania palustris]